MLVTGGGAPHTMKPHYSKICEQILGLKNPALPGWDGIEAGLDSETLVADILSIASTSAQNEIR